MKKNLWPSNALLTSFVLASLVLAPEVHATDYSWNNASQSSWATAGNWSPGGGPPTSADNILTPLQFGNILLNTSSASVNNWTFNSNTATVQNIIGNNGASVAAVNVAGTFTKSGTSSLIFRNSSTQLISFTANALSVTDGSLAITNFTSLTLGSADLSGGILSLTSPGVTRTITGNLNMSGSAILNLENSGASGGSSSMTVGSLTSASATNIIRVNANSSNFSTGTLTLNNASGSSTYAGIIQNGGTAPNVMNVAKQGAGTQIFSGANTYSGTTTVTAGTLLINGTHTNAGAYSVTGGTFGGSGTITTATNAGIVISSTGKLAPGGGADNSLSATLGTGTLDLSGISTAALVFDLDTVGAGSDVFTLTTGVLDIGTLNFNEFDFLTGLGFGTGTYTLFDTNSTILGSIGTASGSLGGGLFNGVLSLSGNDVVLTVSAVPEPSTYVLLASGLGALAFLRRRRNKISS